MKIGLCAQHKDTILDWIANMPIRILKEEDSYTFELHLESDFETWDNNVRDFASVNNWMRQLRIQSHGHNWSRELKLPRYGCIDHQLGDGWGPHDIQGVGVCVLICHPGILTALEKLWGLEKALVLWSNPDNVPPGMGGQAGIFPSKNGRSSSGKFKEAAHAHYHAHALVTRHHVVSFPAPFFPLQFCPWTSLFFSCGSIFFSWHFVCHEEQRLLVCMVLDLAWCFCSVIVQYTVAFVFVKFWIDSIFLVKKWQTNLINYLLPSVLNMHHW